MLRIKLHIVILMLKTCKQNLSILSSVTIARGSGTELNGIIRIIALFYRTSWNRCSHDRKQQIFTQWRGEDVSMHTPFILLTVLCLHRTWVRSGHECVPLIKQRNTTESLINIRLDFSENEEQSFIQSLLILLLQLIQLKSLFIFITFKNLRKVFVCL